MLMKPMTHTAHVAKCFFSLFAWRFQPQLEKMRAEAAAFSSELYLLQFKKKKQREA